MKTILGKIAEYILRGEPMVKTNGRFLAPEAIERAMQEYIKDILKQKKHYYKQLLKTDIKAGDYVASIICEAKLDLIDEIQKEIEKI